ncbi:NRDE family protein [Psychrobacter sp.]|uniref:NRDE family protein n=1 Tax=Psychrobacter sp. TaxID=56811 RepID=UPI0026494EA2|nr:NRDE family protein [Psychrobacter sp.]MDN6275928.1 NRDE family protein [Psychrobacter sp.]MDN6308811.1 NRDE family protein [Psychrobacter sp.]
MCIVAVAWQLFDEMPLVLLSNRDEFLQRPTEPLHQWSDQPIYAGRDKKSGGTWLGVHREQQASFYEQNGRWAAVLNYRDGVQASMDERSRGGLVTDFLSSGISPMAFARQISLQDYAGFNLLIGDATQAVVVNNRGHAPTPLYSGLHVISNGQPDDGWFKTEKLRGRLRQEVLPLIAEDDTFAYWQEAAFDVLSDSRQAPADKLPDTGMTNEIEQVLSAIYIEPVAFGEVASDSPTYGTCTQSILTLRKDDNKISRIAADIVSREINTHHLA